MKNIRLGPHFTIEDIQKLRAYNREQTKDMSVEEMNAYYGKGADAALRRIEELRRRNAAAH
ncbi:MAG: hypothetical protein LBM78_03855 [Clostridiales bacterium]|jgi:hypothetical protein|nr:hypothetical protein [Clostridiales bacterium]